MGLVGKRGKRYHWVISGTKVRSFSEVSAAVGIGAGVFSTGQVPARTPLGMVVVEPAWFGLDQPLGILGTPPLGRPTRPVLRSSNPPVAKLHVTSTH